jgi:hypothetical protein
LKTAFRNISHQFKRKSSGTSTGGTNTPPRLASGRYLARRNLHAALQQGTLTGNVLDLIMDKVTWAWLERLNALLHKMMSIEMALKIIEADEGHWETLLLQQFVLRTADFLHKHGIIPLGHLKTFLRTKNTMRFASINVLENWKILSCLSNQYWRCFTGFCYSGPFIEIVNEGQGKTVATQ